MTVSRKSLRDQWHRHYARDSFEPRSSLRILAVFPSPREQASGKLAAIHGDGVAQGSPLPEELVSNHAGIPRELPIQVHGCFPEEFRPQLRTP